MNGTEYSETETVKNLLEMIPEDYRNLVKSALALAFSEGKIVGGEEMAKTIRNYADIYTKRTA